MIKAFYLFVVPGAFDLLYNAFISKHPDFDLMLITVAVVSCMIGAFGHLGVKAYEYSKQGKSMSKIEVLAVLSVAFMVGYIGYEMGRQNREFKFTGMAITAVSFINIEFLLALKKAILKITSNLPELFSVIIKHKFGSEDKKDADNKEL